VRVYLAAAAGVTCMVAGAGAIMGYLLTGGFGLTFYLASAAGLLAAVVLAVLLPASPQREIGRLLTSTGTSLKGRAVVDIATFRHRELGKLNDGLNQMGERMLAFLTTVDENTALLEQTGAQVAGVAGQVSRASQDQAALIREMLAGIEKLAREAGKAASVAEQAAQAAGLSDQAAEQGGQAVEALAGGVHSVAERIAGFRELSGRIGQLVETVGGMAADTNLLALNAAVESARAGSFGSGFAVVAEEVRQLAAGAAQAASRIRETVGQMETLTVGTVATVDAGRQLAADVGGAFAEIRQTAGRNADAAGRLADALRGQAESTGRMVTGAEKIAAMAGEASAQAMRASADSGELTQLSGRLQKVLRIFGYTGEGGDRS